MEAVRLLLNQGLTFREYREDESSLNKVNFLEILKWYAKRCDKICDLVLENAPKYDKLTSHKIQNNIVTACKLETIKAIIVDLNGDNFALLVDESCDISRKEQMAIVLRYVYRMGVVVERFIGIVHVRGTSTLCLKEAIANYLAQHSLSLSYVRGQCYDGASNMQGDLSDLKTLIKKEMGGSFKRMVDLRQSQAEKLQEALDMGELDTGKGLKQELGLARAADTRWGSHYKFSKNIINMFGSIIDVLDTIVVDARSLEERAKHGIVIPNFDEFYVNSGRSRRKVAEHTISHHYRVNVFIKIIDWQLHELKERFNEETTDLLMGVACLNPVDSFSSFDIKKILRMAELYPDDFDENSMITLENKLATYIVDIRDVDE
uniref:DUF4371 domain-containing protein n=1 Tax=Nicotiana tabacum TaxID=4097 RepID=A0A1S3Y715_TOBAC